MREVNSWMREMLTCRSKGAQAKATTSRMREVCMTAQRWLRERIQGRWPTAAVGAGEKRGNPGENCTHRSAEADMAEQHSRDVSQPSGAAK